MSPQIRSDSAVAKTAATAATAAAPSDPRWRWVASVSLLLLIALCLVWEMWLAPLRPGGSWLVLKVVPLLLPLRGVLKGSIYTFQWASMLSLLYVLEGAVRGMTDPDWVSASLGWAELALASLFFVAAVAYLRPAKKAAKAAKAAAESQ